MTKILCGPLEDGGFPLLQSETVARARGLSNAPHWHPTAMVDDIYKGPLTDPALIQAVTEIEPDDFTILDVPSGTRYRIVESSDSAGYVEFEHEINWFTV